MSEALILATFLAIVQMESGGKLNARNGQAVGPAQIKPMVVQDCRKWGRDVTLEDRLTLDGSFRIFRVYTETWILRKGLKDSIQNRANIWRHGPNSISVKNGTATAYSQRIESIVQNANGGGVDADHGKGAHLKDRIP